MDVLDIYDSIPLKICHCKAGRRYFDSIRNMYVHITPEETVRQKTCQLLAGKLGVPLEAIRVEEHLCHYDVREKNGRIDIAICSLGSDGEKSPLAVVECKEERISVRAQQVLDQAADYAFHIKAPYIIVTNGVEMNYYHVDLDNKQTKPIDGLVTYKELMDGEIKVKEDHNEFKRLPYEEYYHIEKLIHYDWFDQKIGEDTDDCLIPTIINLDDCLYDTSHKMHCFATDKFRLIADLGIQHRNYNDASGGEFGTGDYRVIRLMEEKTKREFLVGFSIMTTGRMIKDPKYGTTDGKSVLVIMKNDGERDEMSVQINLNKCLFVDGKTSALSHNALITKKGKSKTGLLDYMKLRNTNLVQNDIIVFGTLDNSRYFYIDNDDIERVLSNAIEYAVYREEYKNG